MKTKIICFGMSDIRYGDSKKPLAWIPVDYYNDVPCYVRASHPTYHGNTFVSLRTWLEKMINDSFPCRIWLKFDDGVEKCIYWYGNPILDEF